LSTLQDIKTVVFDKNLNRVIQSDPMYEALFQNIYTLTALNAFLAQNGMLDEDFLHKLSMGGKEYHLCYKMHDKEETFEFQFFLLSDSWFVVNPTGCYDLYDQLTGLMTEKNILSLLKHEIKRTARDKVSSTAIILDIKHLKNINEMFGYLAGDYVLKEVSRVLHENTRGSDVIGRFKGDKFLIILHKTDAHGTMQYIKKFEEELSRINFCFNDFNFDIELNYGVTLSKEDDTIHKLVDRANKALSKAKKSRATHIEYLL
jgi:diguanylate cyclase (GGDEF)-like protein